MANLATINNNILADSGIDPIDVVTGSGIAGQVAFWSGTTTQAGSNSLFWDNVNGRLGIGTNTPSVDLHLEKTSSPIFRIARTGGTILNLSSSVTATGAQISTGSLSPINFGINGIIAMTLSTSSNLLIGTTVDTGTGQKLQVTGTSLFTDSATFSKVYTNSSDLGVIISATIPGINLRTPSSGRISLISNYNSANSASIVSGTGTNNPTALQMFFDFTNLRVGIGTPTPNTKLDVLGAASIAGGNDGLRIGNVGDNSSYDNVKIYYTGYNAGAPRVYLTPRTTPGSGVVETYFHLQNTNGSSTASNNTMGLLVDGSVGIGNIAPTQKLHVTGSIRVTGAYYDSNNSAGTVGQVLSSTATGTDWVSLSEITGVDGTGTANYIAKWLDANTITDSLLQEGTNSIGLGVTPQAWESVSRALQIGTTGSISSNTSDYRTTIAANAYIATSGAATYLVNAAASQYMQISGTHRWFYAPSGTGVITFSEAMRITAAGDVGVGTTAPSAKLHVVGGGNTSATTALTVQNSDSNSIFRVGNDGKIMLGTLNFTGLIPTNAGSNAPEISGLSIRFLSNISTQAQPGFYFKSVNALSGTAGSQIGVSINEVFSPTSGNATFSNLLLQPNINQTGSAIGITRGLYVNPTLTLAADWRSIETSNSTGWAFYGAGTAPSYLGGNLSIATTNTPRRLNIQVGSGSVAAALGIYDGGGALTSVVGVEAVSTNDLQIATTSAIRIYTGSTLGNVVTTPTNERVRITSAGNVGIGTTSPGAKLEVVGITGTTLIRATAADTNGNADVDIMSTGTTGVSRIYFSDTAASSGFITYNHSADSMTFGTAAATRMTLNSNGNLGLGVTPSSWNTSFIVHQLGGTAYIFGRTAGINQAEIGQNAYFQAGVGWTYLANAFANRYILDGTSGSHVWFTAPSGTAGNGITFTQAMTLDVSGNLAIGTTTTTNRLEVWGTGNTAARVAALSAGTASLILSSGGVTAYTIKSGNGDSSLRIDQDGTDRIILASGGALRFTAYGTGARTGTVAYNLAVDALGNVIETAGGVVDGSGTANYVPLWSDPNTLTNSIISQGAAGISIAGTDNFTNANGGWFFSGSGSYTTGIFSYSSSNNLRIIAPTQVEFYTSASERMRLDSSGNLGLGVVPSAWRSTERALQIGTYTSVTDVFGYSTFGNNYFVNASSQYIFLNSARASVYSQNAGVHAWLTSTTSGTAGQPITFTQAMTLDSSGRLLLGITTSSADGERLQVSGNALITSPGQYVSISSTNGLAIKSATTAANGIIGLTGNGFILQGKDGASTSYPILLQPYGGNVGIGMTSSPTALLHISATASADIIALNYPTLGKVAGIYLDSAAAYYGAGATNTTNAFLAHHTSNVLSFRTGATERMRISATGNVGIGTSTPAYSLDVNGAIRIPNSNYIYINNAAGTAIQAIFMDSGDNLVINTSTGGDLYLRSGGNTVFRALSNGDVNIGGLSATASPLFKILNNGNVGVGTTAPAYKLEVNGTLGVSNTSLFQVTDAGVGTKTIVATFGRTGATATGTAREAGIVFRDASGTTLVGGMTGVRENSGGNYLGGVKLYVNSSVSFPSSTFADLTEAFGILSNGAIRFNTYGTGTRTGTVAYNLAVDASGNVIETAGGVVDGSGTANYISKWQDANTLTNSLLFDNGTNVGIGTNTPQVELAVYSAVTSRIHVQNLASGVSANDGFQFAISGSDGYLWNWENGNILFGTNGSERMRITATGNLLIGSTADTGAGQRLQVTGNAYLSGNLSVLNGFTISSTGSNNLTGAQSTQAAAILRITNSISSFRLTAGTQSMVDIVNTFAPTSGPALHHLLNLEFTVNQTGGASGITRGIFLNAIITAAADFRAIEWTNNTGWGLYGAGTAPSYLGGDLLIGTTTEAYRQGNRAVISLTGVTDALMSFRGSGTSLGYIYASTGSFDINANSRPITFSTTGSERVRILNNGNVGIGTSAPSNKLEVIGSIYTNSTITSNTYSTPGTSLSPVFSDTINLGSGANLSKIQYGNEFSNTNGSYLRFIVNSASSISTPVNAITIKPSGLVQFNQYGSGTNTGTVAYNLAVDASGNVIETAGGVVDGSGTANYISKWQDANTLTNSLLFDNGTNVGIGGSPIDMFFVSSATGGTLAITSGYQAGSLATPIYPTLNFRGYANEIKGQIKSWDVSQNLVNGVLIFSVMNTSGVLTETMRITADGRLGIGTTAPQTALDVTGAIRVSGTGGTGFFNGSNAIFETPIAWGNIGGSAFQIRNTTSLGLVFGASTSQLMTLTTGGNLGIGNTAPGAKLDVSGLTSISTAIFTHTGTDGGIDIRNTGALTTTRSAQIRLSNGTTFFGANDRTYQLVNIGTGSVTASFYIQYWDGANYFDRMRIRDDGNFGIGNSNPTQALVVQRNQNATTQILVQNSDVTNSSSRASVAALSATVAVRMDAIGTTTPGGYLGTTSNHPLYFWSNATERMTITAAGDVGIGTTAPTSILHVYGSSPSPLTVERSTVNSNIGIRYKNATTSWYSGLGSDDSFAFSFNDPNLATGVFKIATNGSTTISSTSSFIVLDNTTPTNGRQWRLSSAVDGKFYITQVGVLDAITILPTTGNVGIGIASPATKLEVFDSVTTQLRVRMSGQADMRIIADTGYGAISNDSNMPLVLRTNATERMRITATGDVGIGNSAPSYKLDVNGIIRSYTGTGTGRIELGTGATFTGIIDYSAVNGLWYFNNRTTAVSSATDYFQFQADGTAILTMKKSGSVRLNSYGTGAIAGTVAYNLAVDASGNIIETAGGVVDGSGTANYLSKWQDANTLTNSLLFDNGTNVGIGTITPQELLTIGATANNGQFFRINNYQATANTAMGGIKFFNTISTGFEVARIEYGLGTTNVNDGTLRFYVGNSGSFNPVMTILQTGNIGVGTTAPSARLHVVGGGNTSATNALIVTNSAGSNDELLKVRNDGAIIIGYAGSTASPLLYSHNRLTPGTITNLGVGLSFSAPLGNQEGTRFWFGSQYSQASASGTNRHILVEYNVNEIGVAVGSTASYAALEIQGSVAQEATSTGIVRGVYVNPSISATTNYRAFEGSVASGTGRWNAYMAGTASNYFRGNVGLNVTSPTAQLHIEGEMKIGGDNGAPNTRLTRINFIRSVYDPTGVGASIDFYRQTSGSEGALAFSTNPGVAGDSAVERMRINAAGNVGINTTNPIGRLDIVGTLVTARFLSTGSLSLIGTDTTASAQTILTLSTGVNNATGPNIILSKSRTQSNGSIVGGDVLGTIQFQGGDGTNSVESSRIQALSADVFSSTSRPSDLLFFTTAASSTTVTERMRIRANGNVGIGDTGPSSRLQVAGDVRISGTGIAIDGYSGGFFDYASGVFRIRAQETTGGAIAFMTAPNGLSNVSTERMRIDANGSLLIGTTQRLGLDTNTNRLQVIGGITVGNGLSTYAYATLQYSTTDFVITGNAHPANLGDNSIIFRTGSSGGGGPIEHMRIVSTGNVGIGTTTPAARFSVQLNGSANQRLANFRNIGGNSYVEIQSSGAGAVALWAAADNQFGIYQNATAGTIGTAVFYVNASGNVGIGNTNPTAKLEVTGESKFDGRQRILNSNSLRFTKSSIDSIYFGDIWFSSTDSLQISSITNSIKIGGGSPAGFTEYIGIASGGATTFSADATINGVRVGKGPNSLSGNTVLGTTPLNAITTGTNNVSIGTNTLRNTTTGSYNIAIGTSAGGIGVAENTTGSLNIFIGAECQGESATDSNRTWIGSPTTTTTWLAGNLLLGSKSNTGERIQVTGTMKVTGATNFGTTVTFNGSTTYNAGAVIRSDNGTATAPSISFESDLNTGIYRASADVLGFTTNGSERMRIDANGYVGIGTSTPKRQLDVSTTGSPEIVLGALNGATDQKYWRVYTANDVMRLGYVNDAFSSAADVLNINRSGNVGIGTTSPNNILTLLRNQNATTALNVINTNVGTDSFSGVQLGSDIAGGTAYTSLVYATSGVTTNGAFRPNGTTLANYGAGGLNLFAQSQPIRFFTGSGTGTQRLTILDDGKVGINTSSPNSNFEVSGSVSKSITTKTAAYTLTDLDYTVVGNTNLSAFTFTLPTAVGRTGRIYVIKNAVGGNTLTVDGNGSETIDGYLTYILSCQSGIIIQSDGANWYVIADINDTSCFVPN